MKRPTLSCHGRVDGMGKLDPAGSYVRVIYKARDCEHYIQISEGEAAQLVAEINGSLTTSPSAISEAPTSADAGRFWLVLREPGKVPERKGSWPAGQTAEILREFMKARPTAHITVLSMGWDGPDVADGPETLAMLDGRSSRTALAHIASTAMAHADAVKPTPSIEVGEMVERLNVTSKMIALGERIKWGSDSALMDDACDLLLSLDAERGRLRDLIKALLEYEPTRSDFGPLRKHELQFQAARDLFIRARELLLDVCDVR